MDVEQMVARKFVDVACEGDAALERGDNVIELTLDIYPTHLNRLIAPRSSCAFTRV